MRVVVIGGTRFIGRAIVDELIAHGHELIVVHRGQTEPPGLPPIQHVHADREHLMDVRDDLLRFGPDAVLDCYAGGRRDTELVLATLDDPSLRLVVLSSGDVYRAYESLHAGSATDAVPLDETSPVRTNLYPYRRQFPDRPDLHEYEKLHVEEQYLARGGTVLRLPAVYGEHDYQRREWLILRRVVAGRGRIPIGAGTLLFSRAYVGDVARGARLALETESSRGRVLNLAERRTPPMALLAKQILDAAGSGAELVRVPDDMLPPDMAITRAVSQHLLMDSTAARALLGFQDSDPDACLRRTVAWHMEHPPAPAREGFAADDAALEHALAGHEA